MITDPADSIISARKLIIAFVILEAIGLAFVIHSIIATKPI